MRLLDKRIMSHFDYLILIFIAPLIILSYVLISEANDALASKQVFYYTISLFIFILVFMFPLRKNLRLVPFLYWIGILLLLAVEFIGVTKLGAKRWIHIPLLDTTIQPSEIIKPIYIDVRIFNTKKTTTHWWIWIKRFWVLFDLYFYTIFSNS